MKLLTVILNLTAATGYLKNPLYTLELTWLQKLSHYTHIILGAAIVFTAVIVILSIVKLLTTSDEKKENFRNWLALFSWFGAGIIALAFFEKFGVPYLVWHCNQQVQYELLAIFCGLSILLLRTFVRSKFAKNLGKFELFD